MSISPTKAPSSPSKCPLCKKEAVLAYRPFCSQRCREIDLYHWLSGTYKIPTQETMDTTTGQDNSPTSEEEKR